MVLQPRPRSRLVFRLCLRCSRPIAVWLVTIMFIQLHIATDRPSPLSKIGAFAKSLQRLVLFLQLHHKVKRMADDAKFLQNHAGSDLLAHLLTSLVQLFLLSFTFRCPLVSIIVVAATIIVAAPVALFAVGLRTKRRDVLAFDQVLALFSTSRDNVLKRNQLFVDLFSSTTFDDGMVGLATKHSRFASGPILVEKLLIRVVISH